MIVDEKEAFSRCLAIHPRDEIGLSSCTVFYAIVLPGRKSGFRAGVGRMLVGKASKSALRPANGSPISSPEALVRNIGYIAVLPDRGKGLDLIWGSLAL